MINVGFAQLFDGIFVGKKNLGTKLDAKALPTLKMAVDRAENELLVTWGGETSHVPLTNVKQWTDVAGTSDRKVVQYASPMVANVSQVAQVENPTLMPPKAQTHTAQVSTPTSHVHAGEGKGKTGKSK
jgi:hypothetical protein